jgi:hypothetical protein
MAEFWGIEDIIANQHDFYRLFSDKIRKSIRVAAPAVIKSFDAATQTVSAQLVIKERVFIDGVYTDKKFLPFTDVPIFMPRAGNFVITMPITVGDECLLVFTDTCIDSWFQDGGEENKQFFQRRHNMNDAFAICGIWNQKNTIPGYVSNALNIRSLDNNVLVEMTNSEINLTTKDPSPTKGSWSKDTLYSPGDIVLNSGTKYSSLRAHLATDKNEPGAGDDWAGFWVAPGDSAINVISDKNVSLKSNKADVVITSSLGKVTIESAGALNIKGSGEMNIESTGPMTIDGKDTIDIKGSGAMTIEGESTMKIKSTGVLGVESSGAVNIKSSGVVSVDGTMVTLAGGGPGIARIGDTVVVSGSDHKGTITGGSSKVYSA